MSFATSQPAAPIAQSSTISAFGHAAQAIEALWWRDIVRFYRQRSRIVGALATPLLFWLLLGSGFSGSFRAGGAESSVGYATFFYPGVMVMIVLFTAIFSTISVIEDRREGFLQAVLVAPISRGAIVAGKILGGSTLALGQAAILLAAMPWLDIHPGASGVALAVLVLTLISFALTGLGFIIAWQLDSTQGFHAIMNLVLMPMWLLSGAFFPPQGASSWLRPLIVMNPLTYGVAALREALAPGAAGVDAPSFGFSLGVTFVFALATFLIARILANRPLDTRLA